MSRKLQSIIQDIKRLPGKHKRVLLAYASFANNDGGNVYPAKDNVAKKAGISRSAVYHNTEELLKVGILVPATSHVCRVPKCNKGETHFWGQQGKYTTVYDINLTALENDQTYLLLNQLKVGVLKQLNLFVSKQLKVGVLKLDTTQGLKKTPAPLGKTPDSSVSHETVINLPTNLSSGTLEDQRKAKPEDPKGVSPKKEQSQNREARIAARQMPSGAWVSEADLLERMGKCWEAFTHANNPTVAEVEMFSQIMAKCDDNTCLPESLMDFARTHIQAKKPGLWGHLQSVEGFHETICGEKVSVTNGLIAQYKACSRNRNECPTCLKKIQGMHCRAQGCKSWVTLGADGEPTDYCPGCMKSVPQYRRESGKHFMMASDL
jgi:hypothetical protein